MQVKKSTLIVKRIFDIVMAIFGLLVLSPIFLVISLAIKIDSKGPVFFKQIRVGLEGKEFKIFKFRTMVTDAEKKGMQITVGKDSRITKVGAFIRKCKIDEIPQLINVLVGEMSFVGPRPEVPKYVAMYSESDREILKVRPGITDLASIEYRDENEVLGKSKNPEKTYIEEVMPAKIVLNQEYISKCSVGYDIFLILKTIKICFT
ncbi:sugar transferase [uncultured Clostridium sp.]|jgi:lipopolysaccharide/colanic/teichoic acid biosynthesis glycosyltransferase|uniref:sugar transferase n=1 Tax=uncultured Clostridium sp. TaxID=59620 RepID=UPI0026329CD4|nr:sugar transferase [uncultured Clostridium sp.]